MIRLFRSLTVAAFLGGSALLFPAGAQVRTDREFTECPQCPEMVAVPAGHFLMGSPAGEAGHLDNEGPRHEVAVRAFALAKYDVTSEQFLTFLKETGYQPDPCNRIVNLGWRSPGRGLAYPPYDSEPQLWPAVCLGWKDAMAYVAWLNSKVKSLHPTATPNPYRLPSEAEWEYAARAGTVTARWWGDGIGTGNADCNGCGSVWDNSELADVGSFTPNPFGLYGMLGNAWQWTADCWHPSYVGAPATGAAWSDGDCSKHVIRGGSWGNVPALVRSAARASSGGMEADYAGLAGIRVARTLP